MRPLPFHPGTCDVSLHRAPGGDVVDAYVAGAGGVCLSVWSSAEAPDEEKTEGEDTATDGV